MKIESSFPWVSFSFPKKYNQVANPCHHLILTTHHTAIHSKKTNASKLNISRYIICIMMSLHFVDCDLRYKLKVFLHNGYWIIVRYSSETFIYLVLIKMSLQIEGFTDAPRTDLVDHRFHILIFLPTFISNIQYFSNRFVHNYPIIVYCTIQQVELEAHLNKSNDTQYKM